MPRVGEASEASFVCTKAVGMVVGACSLCVLRCRALGVRGGLTIVLGQPWAARQSHACRARNDPMHRARRTCGRRDVVPVQHF